MRNVFKSLALLLVLVAGAMLGTGCATGRSFADAGQAEAKTAGEIVTKVASVAPTVFDLVGNLFGIVGGLIDDIHSVTNPAKDAVGLPTDANKPAEAPKLPAPAETGEKPISDVEPQTGTEYVIGGLPSPAALGAG